MNARKEGYGSPVVPGEDSVDLITAEFRNSVALFTVSCKQTLIGPANPRRALIGFRDIITKLWKIETSDERGRLLVWILDRGGEDFEDPEVQARFLNVQALVTRFKALQRFKESVTEARWNWLRAHAVIVIKDTLPDAHGSTIVPAFNAHHVLFDVVPPAWTASTEFRTLYGQELERKVQANYSVFLRDTVGSASKGSSSIADRGHEISYFANAQFMADGKNEEPQARGLNLPSPGHSYEIAYRTVYAAAAHFLSSNSATTRQQSIDDAESAADELHHLGFHLLHLSEFVNL